MPLRKEVACTDCRGNGSENGTAYHTCNICGGTGQTASNQGFFSFAQPCQACRGQGSVIDKQCKTCKAQGIVIKNETVKVKIPAGTQSGKQLRLRDKGMPMLRGGGYGDLYLQIKVETPISLNAEQKELLEKFKDLEDSKNNPENQRFIKKAKKFWESIN